MGLVTTELDSTGLECDHVSCFIGSCNLRAAKNDGKKGAEANTCGELQSWSQPHRKTHRSHRTSLEVPRGSAVGTAHQGQEGRYTCLLASSHLQGCPTGC